MNPLSFIKNHPMGFIVSFIAGMTLGPWTLSTVRRVTGFGVSVPRVDA